MSQFKKYDEYEKYFSNFIQEYTLDDETYRGIFFSDKDLMKIFEQYNSLTENQKDIIDNITDECFGYEEVPWMQSYYIKKYHDNVLHKLGKSEKHGVLPKHIQWYNDLTDYYTDSSGNTVYGFVWFEEDLKTLYHEIGVCKSPATQKFMEHMFDKILSNMIGLESKDDRQIELL